MKKTAGETAERLAELCSDTLGEVLESWHKIVSQAFRFPWDFVSERKSVQNAFVPW